MMGHVDHGKTCLLDAVRGTAVAAKEAGGITQAIGASIIPIDVINKVSGALLSQLKLELKLPGLLFIDTPGHAAFTNLRKRGGNLADIAVLVIDVTQGIQPQTCECIDILKHYKTPFVIALNKVDLLQGWRNDKSVIESINGGQSQQVLALLDTKLYDIVGKLYEMGLQADRFDRISDHTKQVAMVPVSAKTSKGIPELLMVLTGLAQRYLMNKLETSESPAKGTVLEVKEERGLGNVLDVIIYDGVLKSGDVIVVGGAEGPISGKVKAIFLPDPCCDMRDKRARFNPVKSVCAATGVRISAPGCETAVAGMPMRVANNDLEKISAEIAGEIGEVIIDTEDEGVVVKADSLGSLEALLFLLKESKISVRKAGIGPITRQDLAAAEAQRDNNPLFAVVMGFNVPVPEESNVKVLTDVVIYQLIDDYKKWVDGEKANQRKAAREALPYPSKIMLMRGYVFRQRDPAVVGTEIQLGTLKPGVRLMKKDGVAITNVRGIQKEQANLSAAERNLQVAVSYSDVTVGRQVQEGDVLYTFITEEEFRSLKEVKDQLKMDEKEVLREISQIMRVNNPMWGV